MRHEHGTLAFGGRCRFRVKATAESRHFLVSLQDRATSWAGNHAPLTPLEGQTPDTAKLVGLRLLSAPVMWSDPANSLGQNAFERPAGLFINNMLKGSRLLLKHLRPLKGLGMRHAPTTGGAALDNAARPVPTAQADGAASNGLTTQIRVLAGLLVASLVLALGLLLWSAKTQDRIAIDSSRHLARTALAVQFSSIEKLLTDYTFWDDAYLKLVKTTDLDWFDENFADGAYLRDTFGITSSFLINSDDRAIRHMHESEIVGKVGALNIAAHVEGGFMTLLGDARRLVDGEFEAVSGFVTMSGKVYFAAARVIHPQTKDLLQKAPVTPSNAYVAVFLRPLDADLLETLAPEFGLKNLAFTGDAGLPEGTTLSIVSVDGKQFGSLKWVIDLPSRQILFFVLPALLSAALCIGLLGFHFLNRLRRGQEKLHRAMLRAQSADHAKTEFLANMSHELRTPLNAIIGFSEMMRNKAYGPLGHDRYAEYSVNIHDSGKHLLDIINDVLDLSKVEAGKYILDETEIDLRKTTDSVCRLVEPRLIAKSIVLDVNVASDIPAVYADERAIKQILLNLLSNAAKFTRSNGHVTLAWNRDPAGTIQLTVRDDGIGIPAEYLAAVMEPFGQAAGSQIAKESGTGLGLPLTASLVGLHGGEVRIESEVGKGTTVVVEFPANRLLIPSEAQAKTTPVP